VKDMNREDALALAISNAEAAERLLALSEDPLLGSDGPEMTAEEGSRRLDEQRRAASYAAANTHAHVAQAWAAIARQLATHGAERAQAALERRREEADRRSRS
jgi:hypothetical protein